MVKAALSLAVSFAFPLSGSYSIAVSNPFSLRIRTIRNFHAWSLLLPDAIEPSSFSIDWVREVVLAGADVRISR